MASLLPNVLKALFIFLDILMVATLIYTLCTDGLPFRMELLTPWMATTLIDFYILTLGLAVWVAYKEPNCVCAAIWVILLICFGSVTTCSFIVVQLFKLSSQDAFQDPMYYLLVRHDSKDNTERKRKFSAVVAARFLFGALSCLMLGDLIYTILTDGTPFRKELFTPWIIATLVDLYINIITLSVWVLYKESSWITAFVWIVLFICLGSVTICAYIVIQFFKLSPQDPLYLVLLKNNRSSDNILMARQKTGDIDELQGALIPN